jgi:ABC-type amino acid transport substrate-binding protein
MLRLKFRPTFLFLLIVLVLGLTVSCDDSGDTWQRIQESGTIRVGLDPTYPPFELMEDGKLRGIDAEIAEAIGDDLDLQVSFSHFGYDGLYDALFTGQVDVLISAMVVLPEKTKDFAYTQPYFDAGQILVSRTENDYQSVSDIGQTAIAVELGSEGHVIANQLQRNNAGLVVMPYRSSDEALAAVVNSDADLAIVDSITGQLYLNAEPTLTTSRQPVSSEPFALVVRRADDELLDQLVSTLEGLMDDGSVARIIGRWLQNEDTLSQ